MTREEKISEINDIISEWGSTTSTDLKLVKSPCIKSLGNNHTNVSQLIESFYVDGVNVVTYHNDVEMDVDFLEYEELSDNILDEVYYIIEAYDVEMDKTMKRIKD